MMNGRLKAQVIKGMLSYLRDPKSRMILLIPPLMQLFIFSFAATLEVRNVDMVLLDQDSGRWSHEVTQRIAAAEFVEALRAVDSPAQMHQAIDQRDALLAVRFQPDFSRRIESGLPATAQVVLDGRRANTAQIAQGYLDAIVAEINGELNQEDASIAPQTMVRNWFNPNLEYRWFIVPALVGTLAMATSLIVCALSIAREREMGTFDQLLVSPAKPLEIIIGKTLPALIVGSGLGCIMIAAGAFLFRIPFTGSLVLVLLSLVLFILSVVGIGLMISAVSQTQQQAILGAFSFIVPLIFLSGFATPVENMPDWLQVVAQANPLKHFLVIVQGSFLKALPPGVVVTSAWPLLAIFTITFSMAVLFVKGRLQ